jgi:hypothetical protein
VVEGAGFTAAPVAGGGFFPFAGAEEAAAGFLGAGFLGAAHAETPTSVASRTGSRIERMWIGLELFLRAESHSTL